MSEVGSHALGVPMLGSAEQPPREVFWYLARYVPDLARGESMNVGLIVRRAEDDVLNFRFLPSLPVSARDMDVKNYVEQVTDWSRQMNRYYARCLIWLPKRKPYPPFSMVLAGHKIVGGRVDFDGMFRQLVETATPAISQSDEAALADYQKLLLFLQENYADDVTREESPAELATRLILGQGGSRLPLPESE